MTLTAETIDAIWRAALKILHRTGVAMPCDQALAILQEAGCRVEGDRVRFPEALVERCVAEAPSNWVVYDRAGRPALDIGHSRTYFGSADVTPWIRDHRTGERRKALVQDCREAGRVIDGLSNIDFARPFVTPSDAEAGRAPVHAFEALVANTSKPVAVDVAGRENMEAIVAMAGAIRGGLGELRARPFLFTLVEPISPLSYPREEAEKILFLAEHGVPQFIGATVMLGTTSPVTMAGALAQGAAEDLAGLVLAQLKQPGSPVGIGVSTGVMDMATMVFCSGTPEGALGPTAFADIARAHGLPTWSNGCSTNSKVVDQQAASEALLSCFMNVAAGTDVVYDAGYLDSGMTASLELMVIADEQIGMARRALRKISVTDESLALDVIDAVGPRGEFLTSEHTASHFRAELWFPTLIDRLGHDDWRDAGAATMGERARQQIGRILETHVPEALPEAVLQQLAEIRGGAATPVAASDTTP